MQGPGDRAGSSFYNPCPPGRTLGGTGAPECRPGDDLAALGPVEEGVGAAVDGTDVLDTDGEMGSADETGLEGLEGLAGCGPLWLKSTKPENKMKRYFFIL